MGEMVQPTTSRDYSLPIIDGEAVPTVYHSLVEAAIRDGVAPERIMTAWSLREALWGAVSAAGAGVMLIQYWWIGLGVMVLALLAALRHTKPLNVRLGYCAVVDPTLCEWGVRRGYLSLIPVPHEHRERWADRNNELLAQAEEDADLPAGRTSALINVGSSALVLLAKVSIGVMLLVAAWREPGWASVGIGGAVGAFFVVQSIVRLPTMLAGLSSRART